jgi:hypothetical protein
MFVVLLAATAMLLWNAHRLGLPVLAGGAAAIVAGLCAVGSLCALHATAGNPSEQ